MNIKKITVHAGRTFNDPYEAFSNYRPGLSIEAELVSGEDLTAAIRNLQAIAEAEMNGHKHELLAQAKRRSERKLWGDPVAKPESDYHKEVREAVDRLRAEYGNTVCTQFLRKLDEDIPF